MTVPYPDNSKEPPREPRPEVKQVTTGEVNRRPKGIGAKFRETFGGQDARGAWSSAIVEVFVPAAKDTVADLVTTAFERMIFGETRRPSRGRSSTGGRVDYSRYANTRSDSGRDRRPVRTTAGTDRIGDILFNSRADAEAVLNAMDDLIDRYGQVSVADLFDLTGITGTHTDQQWGWTDTRGFGQRRTRDGFMLDLPREESLKS